MIYVPDKFQPRHPFPYPPDNICEFERWYFENYDNQQEDREYLPVFWTAYYCRHKFGQDEMAMRRLQQFLNRLDKSKKYYTIIQYDGGLLHDVSHLDIKVFSMSGGRTDYPLPLIYEGVHHYAPPFRKTIYANFVGSLTHPIRKAVIDGLLDKRFIMNGRPQYLVTTEKHNLYKYRTILASSTFTLCPRGFGPTSFRIQEALQYGSIPVYISDEFVIPHNIPFEQYGVLIEAKDAHRVHDILTAIPSEEIALKQAAIPEIYQKYFTYDGCSNMIRQEVARITSLISS